jgi:hypothetical protein
MSLEAGFVSHLRKVREGVAKRKPRVIHVPEKLARYADLKGLFEDLAGLSESLSVGKKGCRDRRSIPPVETCSGEMTSFWPDRNWFFD